MQHSRGTCRVRLPRASAHSMSSTCQHINLTLCVFLVKTPHLIHTVDSSALSPRPTALWLGPEWSLSNTRIFSLKHIAAFSRLGTRNHTWALPLGAFLNSKVTKKKHENPWKEPWLRNEGWNKKPVRSLVQPQLGTCTLGDSKFLLLCACLWKCCKYRFCSYK